MAGSSAVSVAAVSVVVLALFLTGIYFWNRRRRRRSLIHLQTVQNSNSGSVKLHHHQPESTGKKTLFNWDDNPSLVNDAVENGWTQFAFTSDMSSSPNPTSRLLGLCAAAGEIEKEIPMAEISWEVSQGSADFMQKIRLNRAMNQSSPVFSVLKTALPLPGPPLASFPQEAYFEITILNLSGEGIEPAGAGKEGDKIKLIPENCNSKMSSESLAYFSSSNKVSNVEELKLDRRDEEDEAVEDVMLCVGLAAGGGAAGFEFPGRYSGSVGFNSNGSVYLDGIKLVFESEKEEWGKAEKVIGCGFDPKQKKVFFTVDSELVHMINCKSDEFEYPLYPTLAASAEVTVLVNLGQSMFKYIPAQRTPNPCFVSPLTNAPGSGGCHGNGYEDSRELFSMGMIDSQWFNRVTPKHNNNLVVVDHREDDEFSDEIELFEIVVGDEDVKSLR